MANATKFLTVFTEAFNSIIASTTNNNKDEQSSFDKMSFEEKTRTLIIDDKEQWEHFREWLRVEGAVTNIAVKALLFDFVAERERIMRIQEKIDCVDSKKRNTNVNNERRNLKAPLHQIGESVISFTSQIMGSLQDEKAESKLWGKHVTSSRAA